MTKSTPPEIQIFESAKKLDSFAADSIITLAQAAVEKRGVCHLVLSGGGTPMPVYELLSQAAYMEKFPWSRTHVYWGDERIVPADHPGSNYGQARNILLDKAPIHAENIHRVKGELSSSAAAADYRQTLRQLGKDENSWPIFDIVLLGMGDDGHTASLFPGSIDPTEDRVSVMAVQAEYEDRPAYRVTMTPPLFNTARQIIFLVKGSSKAATVAAVLNGPVDKNRWPVQRIRPVRGRVLWLIDNEAAARL